MKNKKLKIVLGIVVGLLLIGGVFVLTVPSGSNIVTDEERFRYFYSEADTKKITDKLDSYTDSDIRSFEKNKELMKLANKFTLEEDKNDYLKEHLLNLDSLYSGEKIHKKVWIYDRESKKDQKRLEWLEKENKDIYIISLRMLSSKETLTSLLSYNDKLKEVSLEGLGGITLSLDGSSYKGKIDIVDRVDIKRDSKFKGWIDEK